MVWLCVAKKDCGLLCAVLWYWTSPKECMRWEVFAGSWLCVWWWPGCWSASVLPRASRPQERYCLLLPHFIPLFAWGFLFVWGGWGGGRVELLAESSPFPILLVRFPDFCGVYLSWVIYMCIVLTSLFVPCPHSVRVCQGCRLLLSSLHQHYFCYYFHPWSYATITSPVVIISITLVIGCSVDHLPKHCFDQLSHHHFHSHRHHCHFHYHHHHH